MYYFQPTDREDLPAGSDWMLLELPEGDVRLLVARDADPIAVPAELLCELVKKIVASAYNTDPPPLRLVREA